MDVIELQVAPVGFPRPGRRRAVEGGMLIERDALKDNTYTALLGLSLQENGFGNRSTLVA